MPITEARDPGAEPATIPAVGRDVMHLREEGVAPGAGNAAHGRRQARRNPVRGLRIIVEPLLGGQVNPDQDGRVREGEGILHRFPRAIRRITAL